MSEKVSRLFPEPAPQAQPNLLKLHNAIATVFGSFELHQVEPCEGWMRLSVADSSDQVRVAVDADELRALAAMFADAADALEVRLSPAAIEALRAESGQRAPVLAPVDSEGGEL